MKAAKDDGADFRSLLKHKEHKKEGGPNFLIQISELNLKYSLLISFKVFNLSSLKIFLIKKLSEKKILFEIIESNLFKK